MTNRSVLYVDFGYATAREWWEEVGLPAYHRFEAGQSRATAMDAALHAWQVNEWVWHQENHGINNQHNPDYKKFLNDLIVKCPELAWVHDIADATKHRGLGRPFDVQRVNPPVAGQALSIGGGAVLSLGGGRVLTFGGSGLTIDLTDGSRHTVADVLATVITFWQARIP